VTILDLSANGQLGEIDQGAVEPQDDGNQDVLCTPPCGHRLRREVLRRLRPIPLNVSAHRGKVRPEVSQYLTAGTSQGIQRSRAYGSGGERRRNGG
jgi:hypothetical protein